MIAVDKAPIPENSLFEDRWVQEMTNMFIMEFGAALDIELTKQELHKFFKEHAYNPKGNLINNYTHQIANTSVIQIYDFIKIKKPVISGNGCLFQQHDKGFNPQIEWIISLMDRRKELKKKMFEAMVKGDDALYQVYYRLQLNTKIKINSLYGATGYIHFILYNLYLAQAVTAYGQTIISTAAQTFEAFIADHYCFLDSSSIYALIRDCVKESVEPENLALLQDPNIREITPEECFDRLMTQIVFKASDQFKSSLKAMLSNCDPEALKLIYYKNNLRGIFVENPYLREMLREYIVNIHSYGKDDNGNQILIPTLMSPNKEDLDNQSVMLNDKMWEYIHLFVLYKAPIYDRIRKTKYQYKKAVSYIDTDSNFLCLGPWAKFLNEKILHPEDLPKTQQEADNRLFAVANSFNIWVSDVVHTMFRILTRNMNVNDKIGSRLNMKSEVLYSRIVFVKVKKRYLGKMKLKEGNLVPPKKQPDFKGFDFMKSTTKDFVKDFYVKLSMDEILTPDEISTRKVFRAIRAFEQQIRTDLESGETKYYKQANIKRIEEYGVRAFSMQGIKAVTLWNVLNPEYQIQLPGDVDIVPMRWDAGRKKRENPKVLKPEYVFCGKKSKVVKDKETGAQTVESVSIYMDNDTPALNELREKYPDVYHILDRDIFHNDNPDIRKMGIKWLAKPKNPNIPVPAWFYDFVDSDSIVDDTLKLYYPVLESIGLNISQISATTAHYTNMVSL